MKVTHINPSSFLTAISRSLPARWLTHFVRSLKTKVVKTSFVAIVSIFVVAAIACQFIVTRSSQTGPEPGVAILVNHIGDPQVAAILRRSCEDCHSSRVALPWYGHVPPASWLVKSHVERAIKKWDLAG
jgi:hypothetical protein